MECYRSRYHRLDSLVTDDHEEENQKIAVLGSQSDLKYYMKFRVTAKLHQKIMSSILLLKRFRDVYVEAMHTLAEHVMQLNNGNSYLFKRLPNAP